jgi:hypothetical protein
MNKSASVKTLPAFPAVTSLPPERSALRAGLAFLEGVAAGWTRAELVAWIDAELVAPGRMVRPASVHEVAIGAIALDPATSARVARVAPLAELPKLLAMARSRAVVALRGFIAATQDDRFLKAAIFASRVERVSKDGTSVWVARVSEKDLLGDIVLSLFTVDILMHRELHERQLCVCEVCGRVSFHPFFTTRVGCPEHIPRSEARSGFHCSKKTSTDEPSSGGSKG